MAEEVVGWRLMLLAEVMELEAGGRCCWVWRWRGAMLAGEDGGWG